VVAAAVPREVAVTQKDTKALALAMDPVPVRDLAKALVLMMDIPEEEMVLAKAVAATRRDTRALVPEMVLGLKDIKEVDLMMDLVLGPRDIRAAALEMATAMDPVPRDLMMDTLEAEMEEEMVVDQAAMIMPHQLQWRKGMVVS